MPHQIMTANAARSNAKAVYYPAANGGLRLARVQVFSSPRFTPEGWEAIAPQRGKSDWERALEEGRRARLAELETDEERKAREDAALQRATRRARRNAFDLIMCNHDLDAFLTFTYSPDKVDDKAAYDECYLYLKTWLSNGVQRRGLKYIVIPELTKKGDIHFHALCNASALRLVEARNAKTGRLVKHHGDQVYNVKDWKRGFTTAQLIRTREGATDSREAVAKYMFKYMTKELGAKIGGRYYLHGGKLVAPTVAYGDGATQFMTADEAAQADFFEIDLPNGGGKYWEYNFLKPRVSENRK